jgi:hypothetical protein
MVAFRSCEKDGTFLPVVPQIALGRKEGRQRRVCQRLSFYPPACRHDGPALGTAASPKASTRTVHEPADRAYGRFSLGQALDRRSHVKTRAEKKSQPPAPRRAKKTVA